MDKDEIAILLHSIEARETSLAAIGEESSLFADYVSDKMQGLGLKSLLNGSISIDLISSNTVDLLFHGMSGNLQCPIIRSDEYYQLNDDIKKIKYPSLNDVMAFHAVATEILKELDEYKKLELPNFVIPA